MSANHDDWGGPEAEGAPAAPVRRRTVMPAYDPEVDGPVQVEVDGSTGWPPDRVVASGCRSVRQTVDPFADGAPPEPFEEASADGNSMVPGFSSLKRVDMGVAREHAPAVLACVGLGLVVVFVGPWCGGLAVVAGVATALGVLFSYSQGAREFTTAVASLSLMAVLARYAPWLVVPFMLVVVWTFRLED